MSGYKGLLKSFPINRPLTAQDKKYHLDQNKSLDIEPYPDLTVIRMNSTFLEVVDKFFQGKGFLSLFVATSVVVFIWFSVLTWTVLASQMSGESYPTEGVAVGVGAIVMLLTAAVGFLYFSRHEWIGYSHYPIRLNRETQMVHVFRKDGSVLSVPWAELYFTLDYDFSYFRFWEIHAHVLAEDRETVLETFVLGTSEGVDAGGLAILHAHWEFFRRYMAEGPDAVARFVKSAMPVDGKRESFRSGYEVIMSNYRHPNPVAKVTTALLWPILFLQALVRWVIMRTCKMPRWPEEIESVNKVAADDRYCIDARINPPELRWSRRGKSTS